jgi:hypothetical protein
MLADKYLLKNRVKVEAGVTQSRQIAISVSADDLNRETLLNDSKRSDESEEEFKELAPQEKRKRLTHET